MVCLISGNPVNVKVFIKTVKPMDKKTGIFFFILFIIIAVIPDYSTAKIYPGAERDELYLSLLKNKRTGCVVNHTSLVGERHLVDFLSDKGVIVSKIFAPEHGFRGEAAAGEEINNSTDPETGIRIVSLYGNHKKPAREDLDDLDVVIFDIQDVGCRFYTYISTLHLVIEACAEHDVPLLILDRPNPNGDYVAGPVLERRFTSFVGMDPIPVVHGCTIGELALMIDGEQWHDAGKRCQITVIPVRDYTHNTPYSLPVRPSPNLPNDLAVRLYPSLCLFEATSVSIGRGTGFPFQVIGGTKPISGAFTFTPVDLPGIAMDPVNEGKLCYGVDLRNLTDIPRFTLKYFMEFYQMYPVEKEFLTRENWLNLLMGSDDLIAGIRSGKSSMEIIRNWEPGLEKYKKIRKKYLLYTDFE